MRQEFIGFSFCDIHSSKFNVFAISDGSNYTMPLFAEFEDSTETIDGFDGVYYFGTHFTSKPRAIHCFIEDIDENTLRNIQHWLNPNRMGKLTFDETPYKYYIAKVTNMPSFSYYPKTDGMGGHLYSGYFDIEFTAFDPFAYSYVNSVDDYTYYEDSQSLWFYDSGILYKEETPPSVITNLTSPQQILLYNGGNKRTKPIIKLEGSANSITITNNTTNQSFTLDGLDNIIMVVDCKKGFVRVDDVLANSHHSGGFIDIEGSEGVDRCNTIFTNGSSQVALDNVSSEVVGRFIAANETWYKVVDYNYNTKIATLDTNFTGSTKPYDISIIDLNEISISGDALNLSKIEFDYKFCYL